jgi:lysyl-tRNA synthetase class 2
MDEFRKQKADQLRAEGINPYAAKFDRTHTCKEGYEAKDGTNMQVAGRVMLMRSMGKLTFITLQDHTGKLQIALKAEELGDDYQRALDFIDRGDFIGVSGARFTTKKGEPTVQVASWTMLSKALRQPPEKWAGVVDQETTWRQRYLDTISNRETFDRFMFRSAFIKRLREFYWEHGFVEVDTPVLVNAASGTLATPFTTHHAAYDMDVYLRIATETYLKECIIGGFDRVFEIGRIFRNEGVDPSHLQDFTMVEHYATYWDFEDNMNFTEEMLSTIIKDLLGTTKVNIPDRDGNMVEVDFAAGWKRVSLKDLIIEACGIDIDDHTTADALRDAIKDKSIKLEVDISKLGRGNLIDQLYKKVARPNLINPVFVTQQPVDVSPLARRNDDNPNITDRFQLVVGTWEVNNAYSELIDPVDQAERFEKQAEANAGGDSDAHEKDDEYVKALEYGCPPNSGLGMGIDRIVALLTQQSNLRDVVLFPLMKPEHAESSEQSSVNDVSITATASSNDTTLFLQHAEYGHLLPAAHGLLETNVTVTKAHLLATGEAMAALAERFGGHKDTWRVAGMLHDLDWDSLDKDFEKHCGTELETMLATINAPEALLGDIRAHYAHRYGEDYPLNTQLRKALYCVDELTGFIIAVALVRPSKKLEDVKVKSITKKLKDKGFAAQVDRNQIGACKELLGMERSELIEITLDAMKAIASDLGL